MQAIEDDSIDLVVTSPPYPMIAMWDDVFSRSDPSIRAALAEGAGSVAFSLMHRGLEQVWNEVDRVIRRGGIICVNIGDATRTVGNHFRLYQNHVQVSRYFEDRGFSPLPGIVWRKQSNKPTKFMGSGMLPPHAYVTLEHEYILIFRKGPIEHIAKDLLTPRRSSAYFWEERNIWFSDLWTDVKGVSQDLATINGRAVSAAFPFEIAYRLIAMFSLQGGVVLDPFLGTGTTMIAAMCLARNSAGYEIDSQLAAIIEERIAGVKAFQHSAIGDRLLRHKISMRNKKDRGRTRYTSERYGFPVTTRQETDIWFPVIESIHQSKTGQYCVVYSDP
jgi:DNA modification methylase